jgi:DNA polymerase III subunit alpha
MRRYIRELRPHSIAELAAMVALYRPGPMQHIPTYCRAKHGEEPIRYPHPDLAEVLDETYGVIVYQDQVLLIAQKFAGYTLGEADIMRKAMGKKIPEKMAAERKTFISGAVKKGYTEEDAEKIFQLIEPFAGYAFNKAHAVCYGTIS